MYLLYIYCKDHGTKSEAWEKVEPPIRSYDRDGGRKKGVKIFALSVFGILFVRVRRPSRLLKIVFPLLSPLSLFSSTEGELFHSCSTSHAHYVLVTVSRIVRQVNTVRSCQGCKACLLVRH